MLQQRDSFFQNAPEGIGICGLHISDRSSFHVGLYSNWNSETEVIHFITKNTVWIQDILEENLQRYYFISLDDFPSQFVDSLLALIDILALVPLTDLEIDLCSIVYNGGRFDITTGGYLNNTDAPSIINCSIFVLALLQTYDYNLLDWETWPAIQPNLRNEDLQDWLDFNQVPSQDREAYYNFNKEIRGKHVLAAPLADHHPVNFHEATILSDQLLKLFA